MARPKPTVEPVAMLLRLPPDIGGALDALRGRHSRSGYVAALIREKMSPPA